MLFKRQYYILQQNIVTNYLISNLDNVCVCVCVCVVLSLCYYYSCWKDKIWWPL